MRIDNGDRALFNGDWDIAIREYNEALNASQDAQTQTAALRGIGKANYYEGNYQTAVDSFTKLIRNYSESTDIPYAYFGLSQTYTALDYA